MGMVDFRLKIRHAFRKYRRIIFVALSIWGIIIFVNYMLKNRKIELKPTTTYEPHISVMNDSSSTPKSMQEPIEKLIDSYIQACNEHDYQKAFNLLSDDCREYGFNNSSAKFLEHVLKKIPSKREYVIQNYSNMTLNSKKIYIYDIKYTDDILATGLTNSEYAYTSEKMTFYKDEEDNVKMSVGNYIYHTPIQSISENEYLKIDVIDKIVNYSVEEYEVKFTNRSEYTIVISDGFINSEVVLQLNKETRKTEEQIDIVLEPGASITQKFSFPKYVDDGDTSISLNFASIRVMEVYSGTEVEEEIIQAEIDNAVAKFSMTVSVSEK